MGTTDKWLSRAHSKVSLYKIQDLSRRLPLVLMVHGFLMQTSKNAQSDLSFCSGAHMCLFSTGTHIHSISLSDFKTSDIDSFLSERYKVNDRMMFLECSTKCSINRHIVKSVISDDLSPWY